METTTSRDGFNSLEQRTMFIGFILAGLTIAITGVSYLMNMTFIYQWLVWMIGISFVAVGCITIGWSGALGGSRDNLPEAKYRQLLLLSIPLSFILDTQICGIGLKACSVVCHTLSYVLILLSLIIALRIYQNKPINILLIPLVFLSLVPHCVCHSPVNVLWHQIFAGYAPTCFVIPLAASLYAVAALRGIRPVISTALVIVLLIFIVFIAVGNPLLGFPWEGCVG